MKYSDLVSTLERKPLAPLYLLLGEEEYLRDRAIDVIRSHTTSIGKEEDLDVSSRKSLGQNKEFSCDFLYGDEISGQDLLAHAQEISFFSTYRLLVLKWADKFSASDGEALTSYFLEPFASTTLIVSASKLDGRLKWVQVLKKQAIVVDCLPLYENERLVWVRQEGSRLGVQLDSEAIISLKDLAKDGLYVARYELEKLALYVPPGRKAGSADVLAVQGAECGASVLI